MKSLVRGGFLLITLCLFAVYIYAQSQTRSEETLSIAKNSQEKLNTTEVELSNTSNSDRKLVKTTALVTRAGSSKGSFTATAYCLSGRTALGHGVRRGIIAADPRILRLGSKVGINAGSYTGEYLVSDTGGGVKGKRIDIWVPSCAEARRFGRRTVTISSLE
jgi:3D (Asp-Asp-Asp) domain-containing protein